MNPPDQVSNRAPAQRTLPTGGGRRLRRVYLLMLLVMITFLAGAIGLFATSLSSVGRGHRFLLPAVPASASATIALLLLAAGAVTARLAVTGDLANVNTLHRAALLALIGQVTTVTGGVVALMFGVVLALTDRPVALGIAVGIGGPTAALSFMGGSLRRLVRQTAG
jgi:hypothetical protein